jgi:hypothetical protein
MCRRQLTLAERAILLDGDDPEVVWTWSDAPAQPQGKEAPEPTRTPAGAPDPEDDPADRFFQ